MFRLSFNRVTKVKTNNPDGELTFGIGEVIFYTWTTGMDDRGLHDMMPRTHADYKLENGMTLLNVPRCNLRRES